MLRAFGSAFCMYAYDLFALNYMPRGCSMECRYATLICLHRREECFNTGVQKDMTYGQTAFKTLNLDCRHVKNRSEGEIMLIGLSLFSVANRYWSARMVTFVCMPSRSPAVLGPKTS